MSEAVDLIRAILGEDQFEALEVLEAALTLEIDPFLYCVSRYAISPTLAMRRAAAWAGCAFYDNVPLGFSGKVVPTRLEALASVRLFRMQVLDREVAFAAPDFFGLIKLKRALNGVPGLRRQICLVPSAALRDYLTTAASDALMVAARQRLALTWPRASAQLELTRPARYGFVIAIATVFVLLLIAPFVAEGWLLPVALLLLVAPALMRLAALATPPSHIPPPVRPADEELPVYSILIPLRDEAAMVPQLFAAMWALDYPPTRLDIKFVVEAASPQTLAAVRAMLGDPRVSLVPVPDAAPRTKPKALDYALPLCSGEFVVVYDAEDIPDPDQLWKAAVRFRDTPELACLQAELLIDNDHHGWLAALFAAEYAALFRVFLPALARWRLPVPLGGTSNHFRLEALRRLGGWDAYNVTEDADLGVRLARRAMRVDMLDSTTREHAPTRLRAWLGQRSRWMKGWMQTFIVHNRDPRRLFSELGFGKTLAFEVLVLGMILAPMLHSALLIHLVLQVLTGEALFYKSGWGALYAGIMLLGFVSAIALTTVGLARSRRLRLLPQLLLLPAYWLLMSFATLRALNGLVLTPFHWFKSTHAPVADGKAGRRNTSVGRTAIDKPRPSPSQ